LPLIEHQFEGGFVGEPFLKQLHRPATVLRLHDAKADAEKNKGGKKGFEQRYSMSHLDFLRN
jgi:hypothetical protein